MSGFYYFFETPEFCKAEDMQTSWLCDHGLSSLLDVTKVPRDCTVNKSKGPNGNPGWVVYVKRASGGAEPQDYVYNELKQTWIEGNGFWIGWCNANIPAPEDLERKEMAGGFRLIDEHDNEWILPVVTSPKDQGTLPVDYRFDAAGDQLVKQVKKRYQRYWELAEDAAGYMMATSLKQELRPEWTEGWVIKTAVEFLGINYRVGPHEISALCEAGRAVVDTNFAIQVLHAAIHWRAVLESQDYIDQKKKAQLDFFQKSAEQLLGAEA